MSEKELDPGPESEIPSKSPPSAASDSKDAESIATVSSGGQKSKKSKKSKKIKKIQAVEEEPIEDDQEYDEYKEEDEKGRAHRPDGFFAKLQRLAAIIAVIGAAPYSSRKSKIKGKEKKSKKSKKKEEDKDEDEVSTMAKEPRQDALVTEADLQAEKALLIQTLQHEVENEEINTRKRILVEEEHMRIRRYQLVKTSFKVQERRKNFVDYAIKNFEEQEWSRYMTCNGLPDPAVVQDMNTYLYLWSLEDSLASMKTLPKQCEIAIQLIKKMDEIIEFSLRTTPKYIKECKEVRQRFREKLQHWIDLASYCLLRQIERDTIRVNLRNAKYIQQLTPLVCCFWALIRLPISIRPLAEKDKKAFEVEFEEVGLAVKMPLDLDVYCTAMRVLWYGYDHYSDKAVSYEMPKLPEKLSTDRDLWSFNVREFNRISQIREEQSEDREKRLEEKRALIKRILQPPKDTDSKDKKKKKVRKTDSSSVVMEPPAGTKLASPEDIMLQEEEEVRKERRRILFTRCKKTEINLRKYAILGGLYHIDLIRQPPQPKDMRREIYLTTLQLPKELEYVEFARPYKAPPAAPDSERTPEVIEAEIKALETAMEKLALVTLKLPDTVMWFEPPLVAHWISDQRIWSTEDVHDIKYNEEKQTMTFRTGRLGIHGLAGYKFVNLPFQSWELKPESGKLAGGRGGVVLSITGAIIQLEFIVREDLVSLHSIAGGSSTALQDLIGEFMELDILMLKMKSAGCDVFPEEDAVSYLKGVALKHPCTTKHLQSCMGLLCTAYVFSWSRWNATRPHREIVMQIKEIHGCVAKERSTELLLITPFRTMVVVCSEVSAEFSDKNASPGDKFYSDLYHYALHNAGIKSRLAMQNVSYKLSETMTRLLDATNILNMSA